MVQFGTGPTINDVQLKATEHLNLSDIFTRPIQLNLKLPWTALVLLFWVCYFKTPHLKNCPCVIIDDKNVARQKQNLATTLSSTARTTFKTSEPLILLFPCDLSIIEHNLRFSTHNVGVRATLI